MPYTADIYTNFATTTIRGGAGGAGTPLNSGDTTLLIATGDGTKFPQPATTTFRILIGTTELAQVTGRSTDSLTIVRGVEGTTAQTWAVGTTVQLVVTATELTDYWTAVNQGRWYNVKDYGAKGDGVTNDTTAINAALTAAGTTAGIVYLPAGTYMVSGTTGTAFGGNTTLIIPATGNITIQGDGPGITIIRHITASTNDNILAGGTTVACPNVTIRDLTVDGNGSVGYGIAIQFADRCTFDNLVVLGQNALITCFALFGGTIGRNLVINCRAVGGGASCLQGFEIGAGEIGDMLIGCTATSCLNGFQFDGGTNTLNGTNKNNFCRLEDCEAYACLSAGFNLIDMQDCEVVNCIAQGNTHFGLATQITNLTAATFRLRVVGGSYRANGNGGVNNCGVFLGGNRSAIEGADMSNNNNCGLLLAQCASIPVSDCHFWDDQGSPTQAFGIGVASASTWSGIAVGNRFDSTVTNPTGGGGTVSATFIGNQGLNFVATATITVTASPFTYTNSSGFPQMVIINGGTVSLVQWKRGAGANLSALSASNNTIWLGPGDLIIVTYSVAPTMISVNM